MKHATLGVELAGILIVMMALGWWADQKFQTTPWLMLAGALFGMFGLGCKLWLIWRDQYADRD